MVSEMCSALSTSPKEQALGLLFRYGRCRMWFPRHEITPSRIVARMNESLSRPSLAVIQEHSGGIKSMQREVRGWPWNDWCARLK